jgi:hypothetical protein
MCPTFSELVLRIAPAQASVVEPAAAVPSVEVCPPIGAELEVWTAVERALARRQAVPRRVRVPLLSFRHHRPIELSRSFFVILKGVT